MHLSTHNWMRAEPLDTTLRRIKKFGYESIEISGEPEQYKTRETRASLKEHGIRCWGSVTLMLGERNLAARDQGQRERSVQYVKDVLTMVSELDGEIITLVPGDGRQGGAGRHRGRGMEVGGRRHPRMFHPCQEGRRARRRRAAQSLRDLSVQSWRAGAGVWPTR